MALEYFPCYHSYRKKLAKLSDQEVGRLFRALLEYSEFGETKELTGRESIAFDFIADDISRAKLAYEEKCEVNRRNRQGVLTPGAQIRPSTTVDDRQRPSTNVHKDKDEDKTKSKDKTKFSSDEEKNSTQACGKSDDVVVFVVEEYRKRISQSPSKSCLAELEKFATDMGADCCLRAFDIAIDKRAPKWNFIKGILRNKQAQGVRSLADWDASESLQGRSVSTASVRSRNTVDHTAREDFERMKRILDKMKQEEENESHASQNDLAV